MSRKDNKFNLTDKQRAFCEEYVIDSNATQAFIRAGYAKGGARVNASKLLTNNNIKSYIASLKDNLTKKRGFNQEIYAQEWNDMYFVSNEIPRIYMPLVVYLKLLKENPLWNKCIYDTAQKTVNEGTVKRPNYVQYVKPLVYDKIKAGVELGKIHGAYEKDNKQKSDFKKVIFRLPDNGRG